MTWNFFIGKSKKREGTGISVHSDYNNPENYDDTFESFMLSHYLEELKKLSACKIIWKKRYNRRRRKVQVKNSFKIDIREGAIIQIPA